MSGKSNQTRNNHARFVEGMPPSPVIVLEDLPWIEPLSDNGEEDQRLRQEKIAADNAAYYRQVVEDYRKMHPTRWTRLLNWWRHIRQKDQGPCN